MPDEDDPMPAEAGNGRWSLDEDGCFPLGRELSAVTYHKTLNVIIAVVDDRKVKVIDANSDTIIHQAFVYRPNDSSGRMVDRKCFWEYIPSLDKLFVAEGRSIGLRGEYQGMVMLDTILQSRCTPSGVGASSSSSSISLNSGPSSGNGRRGMIRIELLFQEATELGIHLAKQQQTPSVVSVLQELKKRVDAAQRAAQKNARAAKWTTVCLEITPDDLRRALRPILDKWKRRFNDTTVSVMATAAALLERLDWLHPMSEDDDSHDEFRMLSELARRDTFDTWPHMDYKWASPENMAQAGFYHTPSTKGADKVVCFMCDVCLLSWEPNDDPWSEHERHADRCHFVRGDRTPNVPATIAENLGPAIRMKAPKMLRAVGAPSEKERAFVHVVSRPSAVAVNLVTGGPAALDIDSIVSKFVAVSGKYGHIVIWNADGPLRPALSFVADLKHPMVQAAHHPDVVGFTDLVEDRDGSPVDSSSVLSMENEMELPSVASGSFLTATDVRGLEVTAMCLTALQVRLSSDYNWGYPDGPVYCSYPVTATGPFLFVGAHLSRVVRRTDASNAPSNGGKKSLETVAQKAGLVLEKLPYIMVYSLTDHYMSGLMNGGGRAKISFGETVVAPDSKNDGKSPPRKLEESPSSPPKACTETATDSKKEAMAAVAAALPEGADENMTGFYLDEDGIVTLDDGVDLEGVEEAELNALKSANAGVVKYANLVSQGEKSLAEQAAEARRSILKKRNSIDGGKNAIPPPPLVQVLKIPWKKFFAYSGKVCENRSFFVADIVSFPSSDLLLVLLVRDYEFDKRQEPLGNQSSPDEVINETAADQARARAAIPDDRDDTDFHGALIAYNCLKVMVCGAQAGNPGIDPIEEDPVVVKMFPSRNDVPSYIYPPPVDFVEDMLASSGDFVGERRPSSPAVFAPGATVNKRIRKEQTETVIVGTRGGMVQVLSLTDLRTLAQIQLSSKQEVVSIFYCPSTERLCCAAKSGALHYIVAKNRSADPDSYGVIAGDNPEVVSNLMGKPLDAKFISWVTSSLKCEPLIPAFTCLAPPGWTEVSQAFQQRRAGPGATPASYRAAGASASAKMYPSAAAADGTAAGKTGGGVPAPVSFTKTYTTQGSDSMLASHHEYLFEITLPRTCSIGEVEVQFLSTRISPDDAPRMEVLLLRHTTAARNEDDFEQGRPCGAMRLMPIPQGAEAQDPSTTGPVSRSYLDDHMDDVICGPFSLAECCDLTGNGGMVTLTCPYLVTAKVKGLILLFRLRGQLGAEPPPPQPQPGAVRVRRPTEMPTLALPKNVDNEKLVKIIKGKLKSSKFKAFGTMGNAYVDFPASMGGTGLSAAVAGANRGRTVASATAVGSRAWLGQVSITIRKCYFSKRVEERCIRSALLHCSLFHERVFHHLGNRVPNGDPKKSTADESVRTQILDLLLWIATTLLTSPPCVPDRSGEGSSKNNRWGSSTAPAYDPARKRALEFVVSLVDMSNKLVDMCLLNASRTTAHKTARLFTLALTYAKTVEDEDLFNNIGARLCDALVKRLKHTLVAPSAGAVHWFFVLFNHVKACKPTLALQACLSTLEVIAEQMGERDDYFSAVFRSRYGLYEMPLEADLFEFPANRIASLGNVPLPPPAQVSLLPAAGVAVPGQPLRTVDPKHSHHKTGSTIPPTSVIDPFTGTVIHPHGLSAGLPNSMDNPTGIEIRQSSSSAGTDWDLRDIVELWTAERHSQKGKPLDQTPAGIYLRSLNGNRLMQPLLQKTPADVMVGLLEAEPLSFALKESSEGTKLEKTAGSSFGLVMGSKLDLTQTPSFDAPSLFPPNELSPGDSMWIWERLLRDGYDYNYKILIERLHSGARRYVTLDFGQSVVLTDICIPPCGDISSVIIDTWIEGEDIDGKTIATAKDVGKNMVTLCDLHPQVVCRYLKLTVVGKYGLNSQTKSKVPLGLFFGHALSVGEGDPRYLRFGRATQERINSTAKLFMVRAAAAEVSCHYDMTCTRLKNLVVTNAYPGTPNRDHLKHFLERVELNVETVNGVPIPATEEDRKIYGVFLECLQLQQRLNILRGIQSRIETYLGLNHSPYTRATMQLLSSPNKLTCASKDQLRIISHHVLASACSAAYNVFLDEMKYPPEGKPSTEDFKRKQCASLFESFCVKGWSCRQQVGISGLLLSLFGRERWFGEFIADAIVKLFTNSYVEPLPQERVFTLLTFLGQQAVVKYDNTDVARCTLHRLIELLAPLQSSSNTSRLSSFDTDPFENRSLPHIDSNVVGWMFLYLTACLSTVTSITDSGVWEGSGKEEAFLQSDKNNLDAYLSGGAVHLRRKNRVKGRSSTIARPPTRWSFLFGDCVSSVEGITPLNPNFNNRGLRRRHAIRGLTGSQLMGHWCKVAEKKLSGKFKVYKDAKHLKTGETSKGPSALQDPFMQALSAYGLKYDEQSGCVTLQYGKPVAPKPKEPVEVAAEEDKKDFVLPRDDCLAAAQAIVSYIMTMDFSGGVDLFLLACQNLAYVVRASDGPTLKLREVMSQKQLDDLLGLSLAAPNGGRMFGANLPGSLGMSVPPVGTNWSSWISYTIFTVLVDLLEGEIDETENDKSSATSARASASRSSESCRKATKTTVRRPLPPPIPEDPPVTLPSNAEAFAEGYAVGSALPEEDVSIVEDLEDEFDDEMDMEDDDAEDVDMLDAEEQGYSEDSFYPPLGESDQDSWEDSFGDQYSNPAYEMGDLIYDAAVTPTNDGPGNQLPSIPVTAESVGLPVMVPSSETIGEESGPSEESSETVKKEAMGAASSEVLKEAVLPVRRFRSSGLVSGVLVPGVSSVIDYQTHPDAGALRLPEMQLANMMGCGLGPQALYGSPFTAEEDFVGKMRVDGEDDDATPVPPEIPEELPSSPTPRKQSTPAGLPSSLEMLGQAFNKYFGLIEHGGVSVEKLLLTWLSLNNSLSREMTEADRGEKTTNSNLVIQVVYPVVPLPPASVGCLLTYLRRKTNLSSRVWSLSFQVLAAVANQTIPGADGMDFPLESNSVASWRTIVNDRNFSGFLLRFLSTVPASVATAEVSSAGPVGPCIVDAFDRFIVWMSIRSEAKMSEVKSSIKWKVTMLKLMLDLISGPMQTYQGPVDALHTFVEHVASLEFKNVSVGLMKSVVEAIVSYAADITEKENELERRPGYVTASMGHGALRATSRREDLSQDSYYVPVAGFGSADERNPDLGASGIYRRTYDQNLYSLLVKLVKFASQLARTPVPKSQLASSPRRQEMSLPPPPSGYENQDLEQLTDASKIEQLDHSSDSQTDESKAAAVNVTSSSSTNDMQQQRPRDTPPSFLLDASITVSAVARAINGTSRVMQSLMYAVARCPDNYYDQHPNFPSAAAVGDGKTPYCPTAGAVGKSPYVYDDCYFMERGSRSGPSASSADSATKTSPLAHVGEALRDLLVLLLKEAEDRAHSVMPILDYLKGGSPMGSKNGLPLTNHLLNAFGQVLERGDNVKEFQRLGGFEALAANIVMEVRWEVNSQPSQAAALMQQWLNKPRIPLGQSPYPLLSRDEYSYDPRKSKGLFNVAPLASEVRCARTESTCPTVLVRPAAPHRRARSAPWSYNFKDDTSVDIFLTLPFPVLVFEIIATPQASTLLTCPSGMSVEVQQDDGGVWVPVGSVMPTPCLGNIRMELNPPRIATCLCVRFYKPHDSTSMGLAHLKVMASTVFGTAEAEAKRLSKYGLTNGGAHLALMVNTLQAIDDDEAHAALVIEHDPTILADTIALKSHIMGQLIRAQGLVPALAGMLLRVAANPPPRPPPLPNLFESKSVAEAMGLFEPAMPSIENLLVRICRSGAPEVAEKLIPWLLTAPLPQNVSKPRKNRPDLAVVEVIYRLSRKAAEDINLDQSRRLVLKAMINWLGYVARSSADRLQTASLFGEEGVTGIPAYLHCLACILWEYVNKDDDIVDALLDESLVSMLADWSRGLPGSSKTKIAVDTLLCSACAVKPSLLRSLLRKMNIVKSVKTHDPNVSVSDDSKDRAAEIESAITDESKMGVASREREQVVPMIETFVLKSDDAFDVSPKTLKMLGVVCQSRGGAEFLRDVGLLDKVLSFVLLFCEKNLTRGLVEDAVLDSLKYRGRDDIKKMMNRMSVNGELVSAIIDMFVDLTYCGSGGAVAEWLCLGGGTQFWIPWLLFLARLSHPDGEGSRRQAVATIRLENRQWLNLMETNTMKLLRRCAWCTPKNHATIAEALVVVLMNSPKISPEASIFAHGAPSFLRRLILFVMLEKEKIPVHIQMKSATTDPDTLDYNLFSLPVGSLRNQFPKPNLGGPTKRLGHPSVGTGSTNLIFTARMDETFAEIALRIPGFAAPKRAGAAQQKQGQPKRKLMKSSLFTDYFMEPLEEDYAPYLYNHSEYPNPLGYPYDGEYMPAWVPDVIAGGAGAAGDAARKQQQQQQQKSADELALRPSFSVIVRHDGMKQNLCDRMTAGQLLALLADFDMADPSNMLPLSVCVIKTGNETDTNANETAVMAGFVNGPNALPDSVLLEVRQTPTLLETFAKMGGLVVLAPLLPLMNTLLSKGSMSSVIQAPVGATDRGGAFMFGENPPPKYSKYDTYDEEVMAYQDEVMDFLFPDDLAPGVLNAPISGEIPIYPPGYGAYSAMQGGPLAPVVGTGRGRATSTGASFPSPWDPLAFPPHVLPMMALFLRLHGYSDYFLKCQPKARKLLRLGFGVTDDGDGNCIIPTLEASAKASPTTDANADNVGLAFYPFQALADYLDGLELTTDDGLVARRMLIDAGALHLILGCIAVLSHSRDDQLEMPGRTSELTLSFLRASISPSSENASNTATTSLPPMPPPPMTSLAMIPSMAPTATMMPPGAIAMPFGLHGHGMVGPHGHGMAGPHGPGSGPKMFGPPKASSFVINVANPGVPTIPITFPIPSIVDPNTGVVISQATYATLPMSAPPPGMMSTSVTTSTTTATVPATNGPPGQPVTTTFMVQPSDPHVTLSFQPGAGYATAGPMQPVSMSMGPGPVPVMTHKKQDGGQFWAKGTGFGSGSTAAAWDVERAFKRLEARERHLSALIRCLSAFMRPTCGASMDFKTSVAGKEGEGKDKKEEDSKESGEVQKMDVDGAAAPDSLVISVTEIMKNSCIRDAIRSYLRNDSVLDMARHVPLYSSILELLRAVAASPSLVFLLLLDGHQPQAGSAVISELPSVQQDEDVDMDMDGSMEADAHRSDPLAITNLLNNMHKCVETYARTLRGSQFDSKKKKDTVDPSTASAGGDVAVDESTEEALASNAAEWDEKMAAIDSDDQGLALLIPQIRATAKLVKAVTDKFVKRRSESSSDAVDGSRKRSRPDDQGKKLPRLLTPELYSATMKSLQFVEHEIIKEDDIDAINAVDRIRFTVPFHFERDVRSSMAGGGAGQIQTGRLKRLAQEMVSLSSALPLSLSSSVFVRCDMDRLDVMKVLITGPEDTPYANGIFEFDVFFPLDYPNSPMKVHLQTTGNHSIRFNPNLYNDGKVCLSVLNTWHGRPEEKWNPHTSSLLQVLVSIQSLILVPDPYFNEPGYEKSRHTATGVQASREYDANIRQATVRWAMLEQLRNPTPCFEDVISKHFWLKRGEIMRQLDGWIKEMENPASVRPGRHGVLQQCCKELKRNYALLKEEFIKMRPPNGLEDVVVDIPPPPPPPPAPVEPAVCPRGACAPFYYSPNPAIPAHAYDYGQMAQQPYVGDDPLMMQFLQNATSNLQNQKAKVKADLAKDKKKLMAAKAMYKKLTKAKKAGHVQQQQQQQQQEDKEKEEEEEEEEASGICPDLPSSESDDEGHDDGNGDGGGGFSAVQAIVI